MIQASEFNLPVLNAYSITFFILLFVTTYILPMALLNYSVKRTVESAFEFTLILRKALTLKYLLVYIVTMVYALVLGLGASFLATISAVTVVGPFIIMGIISFVIGVTIFTLGGEVYGEVK